MLEQFLPAGPVFLVVIGAVISVFVEAFVKGSQRRGPIQLTLTLLILLGALVWTIINWVKGAVGIVGIGSLTVDMPTWASWTMLLIFAILAFLLVADRKIGGGESAFVANAAAVPGSQAEREAITNRQENTEVFSLLLFSLAGMMAFLAANDLIMMFVALEVFSMPLYILVGMARKRRLLSQESAMKYFLLGSLSSAIFLYGAALTFGYAGNIESLTQTLQVQGLPVIFNQSLATGFEFNVIASAAAVDLQSPWLLLAGMALICVGVLFKMGAVPFHNWVPDVYQGAPTPITAFMAICTKIAAVVGLLRLLYVAFGSLLWDWQLIIVVIAAITMVVGAVIGLTQKDVKRLIAYSSVVHAGFLLVGIVGALTPASGLADNQIGSVPAVLFYLLAYGFATVGAFAVIMMVRRSATEATSFADWRGLARRSPWVGVVMTIFVLSMAGIPLTGGFIGKVVVFVTSWKGGFEWLVLLALLASVVAVAFYFRVILVMFAKTDSDEQPSEISVVNPSVGTHIVIWICVAATLILGLIPNQVLDLLMQAVTFLG